MAKEAPQVTTVTMIDATVVDFPGKRRMLKSSTITPEGKVIVRFDYINGEVRHFTIPEALLLKFAAHGAEQKIGDNVAGLKGKDGGEADIDDIVFANDELIDQLYNGQWSQVNAGSGLAGVSVLAKALVEHTGQTPAQIKTFLAAKDQAQKIALRNNPKIKPIVERLEAEKAARAAAKGSVAKIDTDTLLDELAGLGGTPPADSVASAEPALI